MPRCSLRPERLSTAPSPPVLPLTRQPRVLVAEDDPEMRRLISIVLRRSGFVVSEVSDGDELWNVVQAASQDEALAPDLIVSDVRMPGRSGLEALRHVQELLQQTAIIFITAFGDEITHQQAYQLGAICVMDKPFDLDELSAAALHVALVRQSSPSS